MRASRLPAAALQRLAGRLARYDEAGARRTAQLEAQCEALREERDRLNHYAAIFERCTWVLPGHFYSPIPDPAELEHRRDVLFGPPPRRLPGIDLRVDAQLELLAELAPLAAECAAAFGDAPTPDGPRYYFANESFGRADAVTLAAILRWLRPARYVEIGAGFSSVLTLDVNERWLAGAVSLTCIDPHPERLDSLLRPGDRAELTVLEQPVQEVDLHRFEELAGGDVCFIDSSHVARTGGDVVHDVFEVLPRLAAGVVVHLHDMHYPFEYPAPWVFEGRAWNEIYLVRALLADSRRYEILFWGSMLAALAPQAWAEAVPGVADSAGGSLWLRVR